MAADAGVVDLFSPFTIGGMRLRNRAVVAPMTRISATAAGEATAQMLRYYEAFARGGWGLVETEATYIDEEQSQCRAGQPGLATPRQREAWRPIVDSVHAHGARIVVQLQHAGALAETRRDGAPSVAPSAVEPRSRQPLPMPRALTRGEIAGIHERFARAASLAVEAGFDGVELHGGNGYLISVPHARDQSAHRRVLAGRWRIASASRSKRCRPCAWPCRTRIRLACVCRSTRPRIPPICGREARWMCARL